MLAALALAAPARTTSSARRSTPYRTSPMSRCRSIRKRRAFRHSRSSSESRCRSSWSSGLPRLEYYCSLSRHGLPDHSGVRRVAPICSSAATGRRAFGSSRHAAGCQHTLADPRPDRDRARRNLPTRWKRKMVRPRRRQAPYARGPARTARLGREAPAAPGSGVVEVNAIGGLRSSTNRATRPREVAAVRLTLEMNHPRGRSKQNNANQEPVTSSARRRAVPGTAARTAGIDRDIQRIVVETRDGDAAAPR